MTLTVGNVAEVAKLCGVPPSLIIDRLLCGLEDSAGFDAEDAAKFG